MPTNQITEVRVMGSQGEGEHITIVVRNKWTGEVGCIDTHCKGDLDSLAAAWIESGYHRATHETIDVVYWERK